MHVPAWHVSVFVHPLPSLHPVPLGAAGFEHVPVAELQVPTVWQESDAAHVTGFEPVQTPLWQASIWLHAFPSLHPVPLGAAGLEHAPVAGLHVPGTWQESDAAHVTGLAPMHVPA